MLKSINDKPSVHDTPRDHHAPRAFHAKYDAAQTHSGNTNHWAESDALSAGAALTPHVRRILRNRARYECANNSFAAGMVETLATDTVGTGPRLQMLTEDSDLNQFVERRFNAWAMEVNLARKLQTMRMARAWDGEAFGLLGTNERLRHPVKLDLRCIEAEQFSDPAYRLTVTESDGIRYDAWGNPTVYSLLRTHPGSLSGRYYDLRADEIPAEAVIHYYKCRRPGQLRGVPDLTPALPLFALLRRYTLAVVSAAETAANVSGIVYTDSPADENAYDIDPLDTFEIVRNMFTSMPAGWKMSQLEAEQPTSTYGEFRDKLLNEIARCLHMPFNVAASDSQDYNYASGRLDHQVYYRAIHVDRDEINHSAMDTRVWRQWVDEASLIENYLPNEMRQVDADMIPHRWHWDGFEHVDPDKESKGEERNLRTGRLTIPDLHAKNGRDWEEQQAKQAAALGLSVEAYRSRLADYLLGPEKPEPVEQEQDEEAEAE